MNLLHDFSASCYSTTITSPNNFKHFSTFAVVTKKGPPGRLSFIEKNLGHSLFLISTQSTAMLQVFGLL